MSEFYKNLPFTDKEKTRLESGFLGFSEFVSIAWSLLKRQFIRAFLIPFGWTMLFVILCGIVYVLILSTIAVFMFATVGNIAYLGEGSDVDILSSLIFYLISFYFIALLIAIPVFFFPQVLQIRSYAVLNDTELKGVMRTKGYYMAGIQSILYNVLMVIIYIPVFIAVSLISSFLTSILFTNSLEDVDPESLVTMADLVSVAPGIVAILLLALVLIAIVSTFIQNIFGYAVNFIILEKQNAIQSMINSYNLILKYFWQNIYRWLPYSAVTFLFTFLIQGLIYYFDFLSAEQPPYGVLSSSISIISLPIFIFIGALYMFYSYTSFMNLRLMQLKDSDK